MLNPMDTSVLLFAWQFAVKTPRPPRGEISLIVNLEGHHAIVDATDARREHVFKDAWVTGLQECAFLTASGGRAWLCGARLTVITTARKKSAAADRDARVTVDEWIAQHR